ELVRLCRRLEPDLIHTHTPKVSVLGRIGARLAGVPAIVNTQHGMYARPGDPLPRRLAVYAVERVAGAASHRELFVNRDDLDVMRGLGLPEDRVRLVPNGVDTGRFEPVSTTERSQAKSRLGFDPDDVVVGAVGRLVAEKGFRELFEAMGTVQATVPGARLVVAGPEEPAKRDALGAGEIAEARAQGVTFLDFVEDMPGFYAGLDVFVLPSHREGLPVSPIEAGAMGLPSVVTDIRGSRDVVRDGDTGLLVTVGDAGGLARALVELAGDRGRREQLGAAARTRVERHFDLDENHRAIRAVYAELGVSP
ncbi:MAG: glycosyltransferase family 4 protein, partial [Actinomycetota bacterium]